MRYNCCQQSGLCPKNKICKPLNSVDKPWKRFTCECPDGYRGDNCKQRIMSCKGYVDTHKKPGIYKVLAPDGSKYDVYCHFDSYGAWTLAQSYSYANRSLVGSTGGHGLSENALEWSGYILQKNIIKSIATNSSKLLLTCNYVKYYDTLRSDHLEITLASFPFTQMQSHGRGNIRWNKCTRLSIFC